MVGNHLTTRETVLAAVLLGQGRTYSLDRAYKSVKKIFWARKHRKNRSGHQHDVLSSGIFLTDAFKAVWVWFASSEQCVVLQNLTAR